MTREAFRRAVFKDRVLRPRVAGVAQHDQVLAGRVAWAVAEQLQDGIATPRGVRAAGADKRPLLAVDIVRLLDEMMWYRSGAEAGYFDVFDSDLLAELAYELLGKTWLVDFEELVNVGLRGRPEVGVETGDWASHWIQAREMLTPDFLECARLALFAGATEWSARLSQLQKYATGAGESADLHKRGPRVDDVAWALSGAEAAFTYSPLTGFTEPLLPQMVASQCARGGRLDAVRPLRRQVAQLAIEPPDEAEAPAPTDIGPPAAPRAARAAVERILETRINEETAWPELPEEQED